MKKTNITALFLLTVITLHAQSEPPKDEGGNIVYTDVVELTDQNKKQIHDKAKLWIVSSLKSGDNMVELSGDNSDQIVGTGNLSLDQLLLPYMGGGTYSEEAVLNFKFLVFCKDRRFKYSVENFSLSFKDAGIKGYVQTSLENIRGHNSWSKGMTRKFTESTLPYVNGKITSLINDFLETMKSEPNDDW